MSTRTLFVAAALSTVTQDHQERPAPSTALPASQRSKRSWRSLLKHYREQMLACDFFTVETLHLQTLYVLFFIEPGSRLVHLAGCSASPDNAWITQLTRQLVWQLG